MLRTYVTVLIIHTAHVKQCIDNSIKTILKVIVELLSSIPIIRMYSSCHNGKLLIRTNKCIFIQEHFKKTVYNNNKKVVKHIISLLTFDRYISFNFTVVMFLDLYDRFIVIVL